MSALRGLLGPARSGQRISHQIGGYVIRAEPAELDALRFEQQARASQRLCPGQQPAVAAGDLAEALELWRGPVLDGMRDVPLVGAAAERLDRQFLAVFEDWAEAELSAGGALGAIERITEVASQHPFRERLRILEMTALAQAGRRSEALAAYDELRRSLAQELGLAPGEALTRLYQCLLREEPAAPARPLYGQAGCCPLPRELPAFTGREECARQLADALTGNGPRVAVVTGPVGIGKTALAVHTAHQLSARFPDGAFFVRLRRPDGAPRAPAEICAELVPAARLPYRARQGADGRVWQDWLAGHQAVVVLDGARQESEIRPLLPAAGDSAVIITARRRLAGLESASRLGVPPFTAAEAMQFLERTIGPPRVAADRPAAARIAAVTGFLPLGLRLAGERLAWLRHVPLSEYLARLESAALLDELAAGDVSIRTELAEALAELPEPAQRAFPLLGMLPEPLFTLDEAAGVLDLDAAVAMRVLEALLEESFIGAPAAETVAHTVVYEMPVLAHAYAREIAGPRG